MTEQPTFDIDSRAGLAIVNWGEIEPTMPLCRQLLERLLSTPGFTARSGILADHRQLRTPPSQEFVQAFIDFMGQCQQDGTFVGPVASVISRHQLDVFGVASMTEILAELAELNPKYRAFVEFSDAVEWLGATMRLASEGARAEHERLQKRTEELKNDHAGLALDRTPFNKTDHDEHMKNLAKHKEDIQRHQKRKD